MLQVTLTNRKSNWFYVVTDNGKTIRDGHGTNFIAAANEANKALLDLELERIRKLLEKNLRPLADFKTKDSSNG